jgi:flavorubredoxin
VTTTFPQVAEAVGAVLDPSEVRWVSFGHLEADECGAMNDWLTLGARASAVHGELGARASAVHGELGASVPLGDLAIRPPHAVVDGGSLELGAKRVTWVDTPHLPHGWDAGLLFYERTATQFVGDCSVALMALADGYEARFRSSVDGGAEP